MKLEIDVEGLWVSDNWRHDGPSLTEFLRDAVKDAIEKEIAKEVRGIAKDPAVVKYVKQMKDQAVKALIAEMEKNK